MTLNIKAVSGLLAEIQDLLPEGYSLQFHAEHYLGQSTEHPDVDINFDPTWVSSPGSIQLSLQA